MVATNGMCPSHWWLPFTSLPASVHSWEWSLHLPALLLFNRSEKKSLLQVLLSPAAYHGLLLLHITLREFMPSLSLLYPALTLFLLVSLCLSSHCSCCATTGTHAPHPQAVYSFDASLPGPLLIILTSCTDLSLSLFATSLAWYRSATSLATSRSRSLLQAVDILTHFLA